MREPVYEVFARKMREEPLRHVGCINALNSELARVCAWKTYDEQNWFEMCVIPRSAILAVNLADSTFSADAPPPAPEIVRGAGAGAYGGSEVV